jgi:hypothetical protein
MGKGWLTAPSRAAPDCSVLPLALPEAGQLVSHIRSSTRAVVDPPAVGAVSSPMYGAWGWRR